MIFSKKAVNVYFFNLIGILLEELKNCVEIGQDFLYFPCHFFPLKTGSLYLALAVLDQSHFEDIDLLAFASHV